MFRPCIDLHEGKVKQIIGGTLADDARPVTHFETDRSPAYYARLYRSDDLRGGHVVLLGPGNEGPAREALAAWPGGLQLGGGVTPHNALEWLDAGASHVIVTSYVFREGRIAWERLKELQNLVSRERLVLDLSCRKRENRYYVVTDRWQKWTETEVNAQTLNRLAECADEFLVHAADVEGKLGGADLDLVALLGAQSPIPTTYAGGVRSLDDIRAVWQAGKGRLFLTIGSALDIFGGPLPYSEVVALSRSLTSRA